MLSPLCAELIYGSVNGGSEGGREESVGVGWRVVKRVLWRRLRGRESAIALACCLEPDALCTFSGGYLHTALPGDAGLSQHG